MKGAKSSMVWSLLVILTVVLSGSSEYISYEPPRPPLSTGGQDRGECQPPKVGDWRVESKVNCADVHLILQGNLIIVRSGSLTFDHVTLQINSGYPDQYEIWVEGEFRVLSSKLTAENADKGYHLTYAPGSKGIIDNSIIERMGGVRVRMEPWKARGLEIRTDNFIVQNSTIQNSSRGIAISGDNIVVRNNEIRHTFHCGIVAEGDREKQVRVRGKIYGNRIHDVHATNGITLIWADYQVYDNSIHNTHDNGIEAIHSHVTIHNNNFLRNDNALDLWNYSTAEVFDNTIRQSVDHGIRINNNKDPGGYMNLRNNTIVTARVAGITVHSSMNVLAEGNDIRNTNCGMLFDGFYSIAKTSEPSEHGYIPNSTRNVTVRDNSFANVVDYFFIADDAQVVFEGNTFEDNIGTYFDDFESYSKYEVFWKYPGVEIEQVDSNHVLSISYGRKGVGLQFSQVGTLSKGHAGGAPVPRKTVLQTKVEILEGSSLITFSSASRGQRGGQFSWLHYSLWLSESEVSILQWGTQRPFRTLHRAGVRLETDTWYNVKIVIESRKNVRTYLNGRLILEYTSSNPLPNTSFTLDAYEYSHIHYDDVHITAVRSA